MATYKKPHIAIMGKTIMGEMLLGGADAFEAFKAHKTAEIRHEDESTTLVPFHAVKQYTSAVTKSDETKADPYCE